MAEEHEERRLKEHPSLKDEDYEDDEEDYDDNLSQENMRELYIAAVDLAIHKVGICTVYCSEERCMKGINLTA